VLRSPSFTSSVPFSPHRCASTKSRRSLLDPLPRPDAAHSDSFFFLWVGTPALAKVPSPPRYHSTSSSPVPRTERPLAGGFFFAVFPPIFPFQEADVSDQARAPPLSIFLIRSCDEGNFAEAICVPRFIVSASPGQKKTWPTRNVWRLRAGRCSLSLHLRRSGAFFSCPGSHYFPNKLLPRVQYFFSLKVSWCHLPLI